MASRHTPTPWAIEYESCDCGGDYPCVHGRFAYKLIAPGTKVAKYRTRPDDLYPWEIADFVEVYNGDGNYNEGDAEFILRACNVHDELVTACEAAYSWIIDYQFDVPDRDTMLPIADKLRAALQKARETDG